MTHKSLIAALVFAALASGSATAQQSPGKGMGDGMGPGMGQGMGQGMGMGHGMMMGRGGMMGMGQGGMMGGCPMMGPMMGMSGDDDKPQPFAEGRIAFLKAELAITEAQEGAWKTYADALRKNLENMRGMHAKMRDMMGAKTPVERLDAHVAMMEGRLSALKEVKPALAGLYGALSDDQKKKAGELLTGMGCMM